MVSKKLLMLLFIVYIKKEDGSGEVYYVPALYLDTLKISSVEKTAENVWAQGGLGNSRLICWDYGKQINVTLEDALCTPGFIRFMLGRHFKFRLERWTYRTRFWN